MTLRVLEGQFARYGDIPRSVPELHELFCAGLDQDLDPEGRFRMVARRADRQLREEPRAEPEATSAGEEPGFLRWILKGDFSEPVKEIADVSARR